jgi:hypothetical protein
MIGLGIHPKPHEFQRIIIIKVGQPDVANFLDKNNLIFDPHSNVEPVDCPIDKSFFSDSIAKVLMPYMMKRSCFPDCLEPRLEKMAASPIPPAETSKIMGPNTLLAGVAALFGGLAMKAMGMGPRQVLDIMSEKPWIGTMLGAGIAYKLLIADRSKEINKILSPAQNYEDSFYNTYFSGHPMMKTSSLGEAAALGTMVGLATLPAAYVLNAYNRKSQYERGTNLFPGSSMSPVNMSTLIGAGTALGSILKKEYGTELAHKIKALR